MKQNRQTTRRQPAAFTLVELLVVIGTLTLLTVMLAPALAGAKPDRHAVQCLDNERRIVQAWRMYADDNNDLLAPNDYPYLTAFTGLSDAQKNLVKNWVVGSIAEASDAAAGANPGKLLLAPQALLSPYVKAVDTYKCAASKLLIAGKPLIRNYSMNLAVGTRWASAANPPGYPSVTANTSRGDPVGGGWLPGSYRDPQSTYFTYGKMSAFNVPGPANTWVLIEENPMTINDGLFAVSMDNTKQVDYPSGLHGGGCGIAFVDGHAELHRWWSPHTYTPDPQALRGQVDRTAAKIDSAADLDWLLARTSAAR